MIKPIFFAFLIFYSSAFAADTLNTSKELLQPPKDITHKDLVDLKLLPSVQDIELTDQERFHKKITTCVAENKELLDIYQIQSVNSYIKNRFNENSMCQEIKTELENALKIHKKVKEILDSEFCKIKKGEKLDLSLQEIDIRKKTISEKYKGIAADYTKYFTYDQDIADIESCINYYNNYTIAEEIYGEKDRISEEIMKKRDFVIGKGFAGLYGENKGFTGFGIITFISDINSGKTSASKAKKYIILETQTKNWYLTDLTDDQAIYKSGKYYISIPLKKGDSYSVDELPYDLFIFQKRIEFPKKEYSVFILKPLY